jgi:hypothetical protein
VQMVTRGFGNEAVGATLARLKDVPGSNGGHPANDQPDR